MQTVHRLQSCAQVFWRARILIVDVMIAVFSFIVLLHIPLYEQYYYFKFGLEILRNTSFIPPNGSFCIKS